MRPTGKLHLGHLFGVLANWRAFQDDPNYECHYMVADWHAFSSEYKKPEQMPMNIIDVACDWLASGIDPEQSAIFVQSAVPEHTELNLLLSMITPLPWLERNPTYKELISELKNKDIHTIGFLGYPVLQAADILIYKANAVPIGADQLPHLELTREIARRFNHFYGEFFPEPEAVLTQTPKVAGTDNRKMSKSYNNCLYLSDSPDELSKKIMVMVTDPARVRRHDKGHPEVCSVFSFHNIINKEEVPQIDADCRSAAIGCHDCKKNMAAKLIAHMEPLYEKRLAWSKQQDQIRDILLAGNRVARQTATINLEAAKKLAGMLW